MAVPTVAGIGTTAEAAGGNVSLPYIASPQLNDVFWALIATRNNLSVSLPSGWTLALERNAGSTFREHLYWKRSDGTETGSITVTHAGATGEAILAKMVSFRGVRTTGNPYDVLAHGNSGAASTTVTGPSVDPTASDCLLCFTGGSKNARTFSAYSGALAEQFDVNTALGNDICLFLATENLASAGATGTRTATEDTAELNAGIMFALEPGQASLGANWGDKIITTDAALILSANQVAGSAAGDNSGWWNVSQHANLDTYYTLSTLPGDGNYVNLYFRLATPGTAGVDGYFLRYSQVAAATDEVRFHRIDNGVVTALGTALLQDFVAGDKLGVRAEGSTLRAYRNTTEIGSITDATYSAAGYGGIGGRATTFRLDDYAIGTFTAAVAGGSRRLLMGVG